ncbi:MAG: hypothetical protein H0X25_18310 [Acidobacteriales bacterium]|nr:hypothetical protein [Terriglobales bacterium]
MKIKLFVASILLLSSTTAMASIYDPAYWGTEYVNVGTLCRIKNGDVLTKTVDDCAKIGGVVTHNLKTIAVPVEKPAKK